MRNNVRALARQVSSDAFDRRFAEPFSYVAAIVVLACGVRALPKFQLEGGQYLLGVLAVIVVSLQLIILGNLMRRSKREG
jgi:hypothetical protein